MEGSEDYKIIINNMARYQLPKPQSMYRDTGLVENTQLFRDRYVQNMAADDMLAQSVLEMSSMEQDQEAKTALIEKYNAQLKQRAQSDNYHMLGSAIQKDARSFINDYQPIKVSKERYDAWAADLKTQYESGFINSETYNLKRSEAHYNYKGIKKNADGATDENSLFVGPSYVKDVNVPEIIDESIKGLVMQELEREGEIPLNSDMSEFEFGKAEGSPAYYLKKGSLVKWVDGAKVQKIVNTVLGDADVRGSINQQAHLQNFNKGESTGGSDLSVATEEINAQILNLETVIDKLEDKKKPSKEEEQELKGAVSLLERIEEARDSGTDDLSLRTALAAHAIQGSYMDYAVTKYAGVQSEKYTTDLTEGARFTQGLKIKSENPTGLAFKGSFTAAEPLGGTSLTSLETSIVDSEAAFEDYGGVSSQIVVDAINIDGTSASIAGFATKYKLDGPTAAGEIKKIKDLYRAMNVLKLRKSELYMASMGVSSEEEYLDNVTETFEDTEYSDSDNADATITVNDITAALNGMGIIPNATSRQTLDHLRSLYKGTIIEESADVATSVQSIQQIRDLVAYISKQRNINTGEQTKDYKENELNDLGAAMQKNILDLSGAYSGKIDIDTKAFNNYLDAEINTDGLILPSFADPTEKTAKQFKKLLGGSDGKGALLDSFKLETDTGKELTWEQLKESDEGIFEDYNKETAPEIDFGKTGLFAIPTTDGRARLAITFVGNDGTEEMYYADASQFTSQEGTFLNNYINGTEFEVQKIYRQGEAGNLTLPYAPIDFIDNDEYLPDNKTKNPFHEMHTVIFNYSGGATIFKDDKGNEIPLTGLGNKIHVLETLPGAPNYGEYIGYSTSRGIKEIAGFLDKHNIKL